MASAYEIEQLRESLEYTIQITGPINLTAFIGQDIAPTSTVEYGGQYPTFSAGLEKISELVQQVSSLMGKAMTLKTQAQSRKKWQNTQAPDIPIDLLFVAIEDARQEVINPVLALQSAVYPTLGDGIDVADMIGAGYLVPEGTVVGEDFLIPPLGYIGGGDDDKLLSLRIGKWFLAENYFIITQAQPVFSQQVMVDGLPLWARVSCVFSAYQVPDYNTYASWFQAGRNVIIIR